MMAHNVWAVIRREYLQRVRSRWFIFATLGVPVFMLASILIPGYFASRSNAAGRQVTIVDRTDALYEPVAERLMEGGYEVTRETWAEDVVATLSRKVTDEELGAFLLLDQATLREGAAGYYAGERPSALRSLAVRQAVVAAALEAHLGEQGVDAGALLGGGELLITVVGDEAQETTEAEMVVGFIGAFLLYMIILLYAVAVMRATLEEKTSRIIEVIVSSMDPWHLMLGKILGVGSVGLTQLAVWALSGLLLATIGIPALLAARPELASMDAMGSLLPGLGEGVMFVVLFVCGYFMFSSLYAAVGSMCNTDEEAQQAQLPVMFLIVVPILFITPVMEDPGSTLATSLSLVPFFTPILMWPRLTAGAVAPWEIPLAIVLMGLTVLGVAWLAGRIYKVGILMTGKRPTVPELWRWIRRG